MARCCDELKAGYLVLFGPIFLFFLNPTAKAVSLETYPKDAFRMTEEITTPLVLSLILNATDIISPSSIFTVTLISDEQWKLTLVNSSVQWNAGEVLNGNNKTVFINGYYWGYVNLYLSLSMDSNETGLTENVLLEKHLVVVVDRTEKTFDSIFSGVAAILLIIITVNLGCQLDIWLMLDVLKKPVGPVCGFLSQFLFMPLLSYFVGRLLIRDPLQRLGLFTLGCSPGGFSSNFWTLIFNGDLNLSITMTCVSTIAAIGMMPAWMSLIGNTLIDEEDTIKIPYFNLVLSLMVLTLPIIIGMIIKWKKPSWAEMGTKSVKPMTLFLIIFFFTVGVYNSYKVFLLMTWQTVVAGLAIGIGGYLFGAIFAILWCLPKDKVIAISIETAMQNGGVAFVLLKLSFQTPDSDIAAIPVLAQLMLTGPPLMLTFTLCQLVKRCSKDDEKEDIKMSQLSPAEKMELLSYKLNN